MDTKKLPDYIDSGKLKDRLIALYCDPESLEFQMDRYKKAVSCYEEYFGAGDISIFSAPGRSEIGGNHTDHQHGEVLAAAINLDAIAIVSPIDRPEISLVSDGYAPIRVSVEDLSVNEKEFGTTAALIRGMLAGMKNRGFQIGGFQAYVTSNVLSGSGLSSSAAFETLIGVILSHLYNEAAVSPETIAIVGQYAENVFFGKPCGLMDQMTSSVGSMIHIDFADPENPITEKLSIAPMMEKYCLCITNTKGSHADLTDDYAAIPVEMKKVAEYFGKEYLNEVSPEEILSHIPELRKTAGDRAVLRALHFELENRRVAKQVEAIKAEDYSRFLQLIRESGNSSYKYLQNIYPAHDYNRQEISLALCLSEIRLGENGVCRVHGGGFAGTIQAFVRKEMAHTYKEQMDCVFGEGACSILMIRGEGGVKVL